MVSQLAEQMIAQMEEADREAILASSAFVLGRFNEYFEAKYGRELDKYIADASGIAKDSPAKNS